MSRKLRIDEVDPALLKPNPWNSNVVSPDNEAKLAASLDRFGFFKPILVRTLDSGELQVLGGEHRWHAAVARRYETVPILNLGVMDETKAKEISLVDNGRYGADDTLRLSQVLESLGDPIDLATFMPFDSHELESIFSSVSIALDDLELGEDDDKPPVLPATRKTQDFQIMRFKVPVEDAEKIQRVIETIMKAQRFTEDDSLTNAGHALVHLVNNAGT